MLLKIFFLEHFFIGGAFRFAGTGQILLVLHLEEGFRDKQDAWWRLPEVGPKEFQDELLGQFSSAFGAGLIETP